MTTTRQLIFIFLVGLTFSCDSPQTNENKNSNTSDTVTRQTSDDFNKSDTIKNTRQGDFTYSPSATKTNIATFRQESKTKLSDIYKQLDKTPQIFF